MSTKNKSTCFTGQHFFSAGNVQPCDGTSQVVFEDFTNNHNKIQIFAQNNTASPCTTILIIETRHNPPMERILPNVVQGVAPTLVIEVEDVRRVSVRCQGNPGGFCNYFLDFQKAFCICCPGDLNKHC